MTPIDESRRRAMIAAVEAYFEACNAASRERFAAVLTEDCVHYFPPETGSPYLGRKAIAELWIGFVRQKGSQWTIDRMVCDGEQICVEWTHFKPLAGERIRGSEWYTFAADGRIDGIWAHYASPRDPDRPANELAGFPYERHGYAMQPPALSERIAAERQRNLAAEGAA
ncbi:MAG TPA: nuclear transport factor 2 family protein [Trueperaceae bacterium]|nr:nuclear transport factor 2 family protein [Trueperaceae bacterium]